MKALLYGIALQWKLDIRSKTLLITCYMVPLLFFAIMGGIFTSIMPESKDTLVPAMTVMGASMGALIGLFFRVTKSQNRELIIWNSFNFPSKQTLKFF